MRDGLPPSDKDGGGLENNDAGFLFGRANGEHASRQASEVVQWSFLNCQSLRAHFAQAVV